MHPLLHLAPLHLAPPEQDVSLCWTELVGQCLIEDTNDLEPPAGKVCVDFIEKGLAGIELYEAELRINEVDQVKLAAALEDPHFATLDVDLQKDRVRKSGKVDAGIEPLNGNLDGFRVPHTESSLLGSSRLEK